ncbi:MAG: hypothetical protein KKD77_24470, partial [Gammaproteobacteria bacterium]|nr:hypothetical protein [Gammaproteobacteria bacterium]
LLVRIGSCRFTQGEFTLAYQVLERIVIGTAILLRQLQDNASMTKDHLGVRRAVSLLDLNPKS